MEDDVIYRVVAIWPNPIGGRDIRDIKDWPTEEGAMGYAQRVFDGRGIVVSVCKYVFAERLR